MEKWEVRYNDEVITSSTQNVKTENCSCITFENTGNDNAIINGNIVLNPGDIREFNNRPDEVIVMPFKISFAGVGTKLSILVIRKFSSTR